MRTITLYTTYGSIQKVETEVRTWGELAQIANEKGIDTERLIATESIRKTDLTHSQAELPEGNFTVFFRKKETKAGQDFSNATYRECRNEIAQIFKVDSEAKGHFNQGSRNYTNKTTEDLRSLLTSYYAEVNNEEESQEIIFEDVPSGQHISLKNYLAEVGRVLEDIELDQEDEELYDRIQFLAEESIEVSEELSEETILVFQDTFALFGGRNDEDSSVLREPTEEEILAQQFKDLEQTR